jgi:hypothetical protein
MHRWLVEVSRSEGDRRLLEGVLAALDVGFFEHEGEQFLAGPLLDACQSSEEAFNKASEVRRSINEATRLNPALELQLTLGSRIIESDSGDKRIHHRLVTIVGEVIVTLQDAICVATGTVGQGDEERCGALPKRKRSANIRPAWETQSPESARSSDRPTP